jgi:hypothetical protein
MVGAKQLETRDFILVPAGVVRPAVVCSRHYIALHLGACSGVATSKAGEEAWPLSPKQSDWGDCQYHGRRSVRAMRVVISVVRLLPLRRGGSPSFYRPRRGRSTGIPHCLATGGGMACSAGELAAVLAALAPVLSSWRVPYLNRGGFEGEGVVVGYGVLRRAQGSR